MAFSIICNNKSCGKQMSPYIDRTTDKAYCSECNGEISGLTSFAKMQLKALGQYEEKSDKSFSIKCKSCTKVDRPVLINEKIYCPKCNKEHNGLSDAFKSMLLLNLSNASKDI